MVIYGLPWATESTALYYNKDIFRIPDTFEELLEIAKSYTGDQYDYLILVTFTSATPFSPPGVMCSER